MKISEGCPQYFRSVSHNIFEVCPMKISEGCPQYFRSVFNEKYRRVIQHYYRSMSNETFMRTKTKIFCFGNSLHTWQNACVSESERIQGMGQGR